MIINLNKGWILKGNNIPELKMDIPGSVLSCLIKDHIIENPYIDNNEVIARLYLKDDYIFLKSFSLNIKELKQYNYLILDGIDTIADIYLNDKYLLKNEDYFISHKILLDKSLLKENNILEIRFTSPYKYINQYDDKGLFKTYSETDPKSIVIRKPNYMFGWDWAPNIADMGLTKDISILSTDEGYLDSYRYEYQFINDKQIQLDISIQYIKHHDSDIHISLSFDDKLIKEETKILKEDNHFSFIIDNPLLWYPNGYGKQPLYDLIIKTKENIYKYKIGFKKLVFHTDIKETGRDFLISCNDIDLFIKGYNYVPEDNILPYINNERIDKLLQLVVSTGANTIRVWGGGYYPNDYFYQRCDELGLLVWQDLMFADAAYNYEDDHFMSLVREEVIQQVKRIRNHTSLLLICGNNENETALNGHEEIFNEHFIKMFCIDIKNIVKSLTNAWYLHSSPTNLDPIFNRPNDPDNFDVHYWEVGNGNNDYDDYGNIYPPMLSEFGVWSLPNYLTLKKYLSNEKELESRNKREGNFYRIENNIKKHFKYQNDIPTYIYLTQLYQARAVKYCVEHLRNNIDRCHGAIYWQLNDSWPGISCSLIDYEYGKKALYYYAKRFFNDDLVSISNNDIYVSHLNNEEQQYHLIYQHKNFNGDIYNQKDINIRVKEPSLMKVLNIDTKLNNDDEYIYIALLDDKNKVISSSIYQNKEDKDIKYNKATFDIRKIDNKTIAIKADTFAKDIYLSHINKEVSFSDNYFSLQKDEIITITCDIDIDIKDISIKCINDL